MSINRFVKKKISEDTAVYWSNPDPNTFGQMTFDSPEEINVYWNDASELIRDNDGREIVTNAIVTVGKDLDDSGMLYHGKLSDLTQAEKDDPKKLSGAYEIKKTAKAPSIRKPDQYVRKVWLSNNQTI